MEAVVGAFSSLCLGETQKNDVVASYIPFHEKKAIKMSSGHSYAVIDHDSPIAYSTTEGSLRRKKVKVKDTDYMESRTVLIFCLGFSIKKKSACFQNLLLSLQDQHLQNHFLPLCKNEFFLVVRL